MQRTAVARALLCRPRVLLADEPTGNLDAETGGQIIRLLKELNRQDGVTIVMVTHNLEIAMGTDRVLKMAAGRLAEEKPAPPAPRLLGVAMEMEIAQRERC
jgi:lipoprotein-releasing system ATP-binding protein